MRCITCLSEGIVLLGCQDFSGGANKAINTNIYLCLQCGSVHRQSLPKGLLYAHLVEGASYNDLNKADYWLRVREDFFKRIFDVVTKHVKPNQRRILDLGCSYGYLLKIFKNHGWETYGVEMSSSAASFARDKLGLTIMESNVEDANFPDESFDVITLIDTLYYMQNPRSVLKSVYRLLRPDGLVIIRNINRTFILKLWYLLLKKNIIRIPPKVPYILTGDAITIPSVRGMRLLLKQSGLSELAFYGESGQGKQMEWKRRVLYKVTYLLWLLSCKRILVSPGILVLAKKNNSDIMY